MSLFEFVTVMVSMILALCLGQLLRSASFLTKTDQQVRYFLPHTLWSVAVLMTVVNHWWSLWDLRDIDWSYASFIYILAAPVLITFATGLLSPNGSTSGPVDLQAHYSRVRRSFSSAMVLYGLFMWFDGPLFTEQDVLGPVGILHIPIIAATAMPAISDDRRLNAAAAGLMISVLLVVMVLRYSAA
jgi:hypothetical protein